MKPSFIPGLKQKTACRLSRWRELPIPGQILVKEGDLLEPQTIVARAELPGDVLILRVAETLGIEAKDFDRGLTVDVGSVVNEADVLYEHRGLFGLFNSKYKSPETGVVDFISHSVGHIGLRLHSRVLQKNAYSGGRVVKVEPGLAVQIETCASLIQGIFGVGGEQQGELLCLPVEPDKKLEITDLPANFKDKILAGGTMPDAVLLEVLAEGQAKGLIVGGIDDTALHALLGYDLGLAVTGNEKIPFSLLVTEGFGHLAISEKVMALLRQENGKFACINGTTQIRAGAVRPEIIIPGPDTESQSVAEPEAGLEIGSRVRLIRVPYFGLTGAVAALPMQPAQLENGVVARIMQVLLDNGQTVVVPRANAELLF